MRNGMEVDLSGVVVSEPELSYTRDAKAFARFELEVSTTAGLSGARKSYVSHVQVICSSATAENVADHLHKGMRVMVAGVLELRPDQAQPEGARRLVLNAAEVAVPLSTWPWPTPAQAGGSEARVPAITDAGQAGPDKVPDRTSPGPVREAGEDRRGPGGRAMAAPSRPGPVGQAKVRASQVRTQRPTTPPSSEAGFGKEPY